jgi:hypothetical protein
MYQGAIHTRTKRQPLYPMLPTVKTHQVSCTILVFDEGFITARADVANDTAVALLRQVHPGHHIPLAAAAPLVQRGATFQDPKDILGVPNGQFTAQDVLKSPQYSHLPLIRAEDVTQAWIAPDSLFRKNGPHTIGMRVNKSCKEFRVTPLANRWHVIIGDVRNAEQLLRKVLPSSILEIKIK